jgi:hypothetical protein
MLNQLIFIRVDRRSQRREFIKDPWQGIGGCAKITIIEGLLLPYDGLGTDGVGCSLCQSMSYPQGFVLSSGHDPTGCGEVGWLFINLRA